uniref:Uncharacterized protein n=1 Tax=Romanomermis culicivorax TaxID=13658 RepID=A0A915L6Z3_ROMCU
MDKTTADDSGSGPEKCGSIVDHEPAPDYGGCPTVDEIMLPHSSTSATFNGCCLPASAGGTKQQNLDWDRQSTGSEISLACLQDRIVQMEETHYSTNEELQKLEKKKEGSSDT